MLSHTSGEAREEPAINKIHRICVAALMIPCFHLAPGMSSAHTVQITTVSPGSERDVSMGSWYQLSDGAGWIFRPESDIDHLELALYDSVAVLAAGPTPFEYCQTRMSGSWPDGPENESGELGYEVSPNVLGDNNQHLYGRPHFKSLRLYGGELSPDSVYRVSFIDSAPDHVWLHPLRSHYFTISADILQSSEGTLINPVYGPASVSRTILSADSTRFEYGGLSPDVATGLKDDYPVGGYGQRPGSHGNGDFGWFPGYSLWCHNEGPGSVTVALFVTTGFTGPSGAPSNTLANDTFWKSEEIFLAAGDTATVKLDFDDVQGYSLSDNPFPHTAGDRSALDGNPGAAINVFDRLQVSAIGWEVRSGSGGPADSKLVITPRATNVDPLASVDVEISSPVRKPELRSVAPNPFGHNTRIDYRTPRTGHVTIRVYDVHGRLIATLVDTSVDAGAHAIFWNAQDDKGSDVASGIYFIRMIAFGQETIRKAMLIR